MEKAPINPLPPEKEEKLEISNPSDYAGGIPALQSSFKHINQELTWNTAFKSLFQLNQKGGIDCPGCAWPDPEGHRSKLGEYCENGVKAIAEEATSKRVDPAFFAQNSIAALSQWSDYELGKSGRLTHPMIKEQGEGHYKPISWEAAFERIARQLNQLSSPHEAIFYTSGRTSNEAAFLYQLFVRQFGTNNLPDCSNMCHESSGVALSETVGIGKGSVTLEDFYITDLILVIGQNPGTNHPRMLSALQKAKQRGAKIITINPLPEAGLLKFKHPQQVSGWLGSGTKLTDLYLPVKINQDIALLKAILVLLFKMEADAPGKIFDQAFVQEKTTGFEALKSDLKQYDPEKLAQQCGIPISDIQSAAKMIAESPKMITCWAMGLTQHENGVQNIKEVVNLLLLKGSIGKPGAGTCPVRGHSNVQGDRTMGIWENPKPAFLDKLDSNFGIKAPREHGLNTIQAIKAMHDGPAKVFFAMGGNFISATPDTLYTAKAIQNCELTVQVSTKLNRSHLVTGKTALILPCLGRTEIDQQESGPQMVSVENSMGVVHSSEGQIPPASEHLKSEPSIIAHLAHHTFREEGPIDWLNYVKNYDLIRGAIEKTIPGFDNYNDRVRQPGGFYLPNGARSGQFNTSSQKAVFSVNSLNENPLQEGQLMMMTIRSHDQFNTTIYGMDDRYRGIKNARRIILMNHKDMEKRQLQSGDLVNLYSHFKGQTRSAMNFKVVPYPIAQECVATYFPETNVLVPIGQFADKSETPASKSIIVSVKKS